MPTFSSPERKKDTRHAWDTEGDNLMTFQEYLGMTGLGNYNPYDKQVKAEVDLNEALQNMKTEAMRNQVEWMMEKIKPFMPTHGGIDMYNFLNQIFGTMPTNFIGPGAQWANK